MIEMFSFILGQSLISIKDYFYIAFNSENKHWECARIVTIKSNCES